MVALTATAQTDDVYYDPSKDKGYQNSTQQYDDVEQQNNTGNSNTPPATYDDKTDGYGEPADSYDYKDESGNTYVTNNYYYDEDDWDDYYYTSRLRRYYGNTWSIGYYSYCYTPSFYWGWNNWNTGFYVSSSPWYNDPWWGWNSWRYRPQVAYYDPFWSYNWGWNSCSYYNSWNSPWYGGGFCSTPYMNGWGWGGGYNQGYYNGYNNGYYNGYYDGYYNGYYNSPYAWNGYYYNGPRHRDSNAGTDRQPVSNGGKLDPRQTDIPREGITKPFEPQRDVPVNNGGKTNNGTITDKGNPAQPGKDVKPDVQNGNWQKPVTPSNSSGKTTEVERWNGTTVTPSAPNVNKPGETGKTSEPGKNYTTPKTYEQPKPYNNEPPKQYNPAPQNEQPRQYNNAPKQYEQPRQYNNQPKQYNQPRGNEQPRQYEQPKQYNQPRGNEQPRQYNNPPQQNNQPKPNYNSQPRQFEQPKQNYNSQPRQFEQPRQNVSPQPRQMERNFSPSPSPGGGFKRGG